MKKVLVVEDSEMVAKVLRHLLVGYPQYQPLFATSMVQTQELVAQHSGEIFAALVDLNLPDAPDGEVVPPITATVSLLVVTANMP